MIMYYIIRPIQSYHGLLLQGNSKSGKTGDPAHTMVGVLFSCTSPSVGKNHDPKTVNKIL